MPKVYSQTVPLGVSALDAFCALEGEFTDQFVYYRKDAPVRCLGLGRCVALGGMDELDWQSAQADAHAPVCFSFKRFDEGNPAPVDDLSNSFPHLRFLLPEVVIIQDDTGIYLQVNSLGPVYEGRVDRFVRRCREAGAAQRRSIAYRLSADDPAAWAAQVEAALDAIGAGGVEKVVLSRRIRLDAEAPFSSKDLLVNLIDGPAQGTVVLYRYGDVFFCACTPELLVRKRGDAVESMCLAGTCPSSSDETERRRAADELLHDDKNLREHAFVANFVRQVFERNCYDVDIPAVPSILTLPNVQHLRTPVRARALEGRSLQNLAGQLHPTPALAGSPVGEALMAIRRIEAWNRGFFGGSMGFVDAAGDGEFSVAIRCGVFDGVTGWLFAGCGIVAGSRAADEHDEIDMKLKAILSAFDGGDR